MFTSKYGVARHIYINVPKAGSANHAVGADWTPAAGDVKISKDGGAAANVTNLPTAIAMGNSTIWDFHLTATEMQAAQINITVSDSATKAVDDTGFVIETYGNASAQHAFDLGTSMDALVDLVWDEILTGATHNVATSAGRRLRALGASSVFDGIAQAGTSNSITLSAGASATNEIYDGNMVVIVGGTGAGQTRVIVEYNGTSKLAYVDEEWVTTPDATSEFQIIAAQQTNITHHGIAQGGAAGSITLSATASTQDHIYVGQTVLIRTSVGSDQSRLITAYDGATKVATVAPNWDINPTSASVYAINPVGSAIVESMSTAALNALAAAVWAKTLP